MTSEASLLKELEDITGVVGHADSSSPTDIKWDVTIPNTLNTFLDSVTPDTKYYRTTTTKNKVNPRAVLEHFIKTYDLDSTAIRTLIISNGNKDLEKLQEGVTISQWQNFLEHIPRYYTVAQQPIIIDGKEVQITNSEASGAALKPLWLKSNLSTISSFGEYIDALRRVSGDEPATNNNIARIGLGVLCLGGIALLVHNSKKNRYQY